MHTCEILISFEKIFFTQLTEMYIPIGNIASYPYLFIHSCNKISPVKYRQIYVSRTHWGKHQILFPFTVHHINHRPMDICVLINTLIVMPIRLSWRQRGVSFVASVATVTINLQYKQHQSTKVTMPTGDAPPTSEWWTILMFCTVGHFVPFCFLWLDTQNDSVNIYLCMPYVS